MKWRMYISQKWHLTTLCLRESTIHNGNTWAAKLCSKKDGFYSLQPFVLPTEECNLGPGARLFRITQEGWDPLPTTSPSLAFPHVLHLLEKELNEQIWRSAALLLSSPLLPTNRASALLCDFLFTCLSSQLGWGQGLSTEWSSSIYLPTYWLRRKKHCNSERRSKMPQITQHLDRYGNQSGSSVCGNTWLLCCPLNSFYVVKIEKWSSNGQ